MLRNLQLFKLPYGSRILTVGNACLGLRITFNLSYVNKNGFWLILCYSLCGGKKMRRLPSEAPCADQRCWYKKALASAKSKDLRGPMSGDRLVFRGHSSYDSTWCLSFPVTYVSPSKLHCIERVTRPKRQSLNDSKKVSYCYGKK